MSRENKQDGMHIGCLNGTVLKELKIVYKMDMRHFSGRRTLRGLRRREKDLEMREYYGEEQYQGYNSQAQEPPEEIVETPDTQSEKDQTPQKNTEKEVEIETVKDMAKITPETPESKASSDGVEKLDQVTPL